MTKTIEVRNSSLPFSASKQFLNDVCSKRELEEFIISLRPIFHTDAPDDSSLSDRQTVNEQIRFYTKHRCLRDFRAIAIHLKNKFPEGVHIKVNNFLCESDKEFFQILSQYINVNIEFNIRADLNYSESNPDVEKIMVGLSNDEDWTWLRNKLGALLNWGDSWTAMWISELVLKTHIKISEMVYDVIGLSFSLQDRTSEAEKMFTLWRGKEGIERARANYSLAMLYARHHPVSFRNDKMAEDLINESWDILNEIEENEHVYYEKIFNRNGIGLIYFRRGEFEVAAELLEEAIDKIEQSSFHKGVHHTVLLNNLGRVYSAYGQNTLAENYLKKVVVLDPNFAEYWLDLAQFYLDNNNFDEAINATVHAEKCSDSISEIYELRAYISNKKGSFLEAVDAYKQAWVINPSKGGNLLGALLNLCEANHYNEAQQLIDILETASFNETERETYELLKLEVEMNKDETYDKLKFIKKLESLLKKYPDSEEINENLRALKMQ